MRFSPKVTAALLLGFALATASAGEVYRWKDASGVWHYSDQPQPGAELMSTSRKPPTPTPAPTAATATTGSVPTGSAQPAGGNDDLPPVSKEVAQQVRSEAAGAKADQCKQAKEHYDRSIQARRMYKTDAKGVRTYYTDAEIDAARLAARSARDLACGK